jgi:hypothetical protein
MWRVVNVTLRPPLPSAEDLTGCHSAGHCPPPRNWFARFRLRPLGMTPRIAQSVTQTLYLLSYTVSYLILDVWYRCYCMIRVLVCCPNSCCCRWWLPSIGMWRREIWYNSSSSRRNMLPPSGDPKMEAEVPRSRLCDVTGIVHIPLWEPSLTLGTAGRFAELSNGQVRQCVGAFLEWKVKIQFGHPCRDHVTSLLRSNAPRCC